MKRLIVFVSALYILTGCFNDPDVEDYSENLEEGQEFLAENMKKEDVITTITGLQYKILESGDPSGHKPGIHDNVTVHYEGSLLDGGIFDTTMDEEPRTFKVGDLINGWSEALQIMVPGDKWELYIPYYLGYGSLGNGNIEPNEMLIFEVEVVSVTINPSYKDNIEASRSFLETNALRDDVTTTTSGLQYSIITSGSSDGSKPSLEDSVLVNYTGKYINNVAFESTEGKDPARFKVDRVIPGLSEALQLMVPGDSWEVFIPYELGYGANGFLPTVEPYSVLIFEVELVSISSD
ncbi:FKBP-type peptidyl-prolyl cis-trans isomerase [Reichenbachiella versicolor]|uniref:FKBP-type peptidyl-prolyl cis-trans isomerase n=1 Tax=Reichenbachiella versicolor TaxID=1821036 RepID=UPI000D6EA475|nr:FKBP-type peptidyl-prolyl cis-trans isomerase [Reichenbachiella versicolor]